MRELKYRLYGVAHHIAKKLLGLDNLTVGKILRYSSIKIGTNKMSASKKWFKFIEASKIEASNKQNGTLYAGYIAEANQWCLPSWIWTNAATVRMYCSCQMMAEAKYLGDKLAEQQQYCGGWIVRNDYDKKGAIPMLAPNDSAYIANNAFISLYLATQETRYLEISRRCADWVIETARPDGMVYTGYNMRDKKWNQDCIIVDVGFTAGLFSRLFVITREEKYYNFLNKFIKRYIDLFYISSNNGFCTSIDKNNRQQGGMFGRGQAWALEGMISAYMVLKDDSIKSVIYATINNLIRVQFKNGGWAYNLTNSLMGEDCKAVSVIAKNMMDWYEVSQDERIKESAKKALQWCYKHTAIEGEAEGGIFSFCIEGAIVHNLYTSVAFTYSSSYAIELEQMLKK